MTLRLTPEMLARAYDFLRSTAPFSRWKLPVAAAVKFRVTSEKTTRGHYRPLTGGHEIAISRRLVGYCPALLSTMAHEICHLRLKLVGKGNVNHGDAFQTLASQICKHHGFDPKEF